MVKPSVRISFGSIVEAYPSPAVTLPLPAWQQYVSQGNNRLYGDAIIPGGTEEDGAVYTGHVRQNPFTAEEGFLLLSKE